jgi:NNP family nitrate/nitrite transporter-like MFS transporter
LSDPAVAQGRDRFPPQIPYIMASEGAERFSFYGMRNILVIYMVQYLAISQADSKAGYHYFVMANYLLPLVGGWLADRFGGATLTFWVFALMIGGVLGVLHFLPGNGSHGDFYGFLACFMVLFVLTGVGNASTFRMIPVIFRTLHERLSAGGDAAGKAAAARQAGIESAAVIGFSSAVGAYGGFFIPKSYGSSIAITGGPQMALYGFIAFYVSCLVVTWWWYYRRGAELPC